MSGKGMSFLNKKSWHTGGFKMIEKVWKAEQKAAEEAKKCETLRKELEEERRVESLRRMQAEAGLLTAQQVERLDWMYVGQGAFRAQEAEKEQEAYLLGKVKKEASNENSELKALATAPGALLLPGHTAAAAAAQADGLTAPGQTPAAAGVSHKSRIKAELEQASLLREGQSTSRHHGILGVRFSVHERRKCTTIAHVRVCCCCFTVLCLSAQIL